MTLALASRSLRKHSSPLFALLLGAILAAACTGDTVSENTATESDEHDEHDEHDAGCELGSERCLCYPNATCNTGLTCLSRRCVDTGDDENDLDAGQVDEEQPDDGSAASEPGNAEEHDGDDSATADDQTPDDSTAETDDDALAASPSDDDDSSGDDGLDPLDGGKTDGRPPNGPDSEDPSSPSAGPDDVPSDGAGGSTSDGLGGTMNASGGAGGATASGMGGSASTGGSAGDASSSAGGMGGNTSTDGSGGEAGSGGTDDAFVASYNPDFEEFSGADCAVTTPLEVNNPLLPNPFEFLSGSSMASKSDWRCRRAEIKKSVETFVHGEKPGRPDLVTGTVSRTAITVHVEHAGKTIDFSASLSLPAGASGPTPALISVGGTLTLDTSILAQEGVATIVYNHAQLASETSRAGLFSDIYGNSGVSAQIAWAWGVSRMLDVLIDERDAGRNDWVDPTAVGVAGCSRLGKAAFTIGAFDERIALGISQESGTGGVSAFRVVQASQGMTPSPQSLDSAWSEAQGWFGAVFEQYKNNVNLIPIDMHSMVAMYAPRGLLVLDNSQIAQLGPVAQHAATAAGAEVFKALGVAKHVAYHGGNAPQAQSHCSFYASQAEPLRQAIRAHLTKTAAADGRIEPQPDATADLTQWIDWSTPTLP